MQINSNPLAVVFICEMHSVKLLDDITRCQKFLHATNMSAHILRYQQNI